jgi:hypothetical protein
MKVLSLLVAEGQKREAALIDFNDHLALALAGYPDGRAAQTLVTWSSLWTTPTIAGVLADLGTRGAARRLVDALDEPSNGDLATRLHEALARIATEAGIGSTPSADEGHAGWERWFEAHEEALPGGPGRMSLPWE